MKNTLITLLLCGCTITSVCAAGDLAGYDRLNIGAGNTLGGTYSTIAGGNANGINVQLSVIGGGQYNTNSGGIADGWNTIPGGYGNLIDGTTSSTVGGGSGNKILEDAYLGTI